MTNQTLLPNPASAAPPDPSTVPSPDAARSEAGAEIVPLAERVRALGALRWVVAVLAILVTWADEPTVLGRLVPVTLAYVAVTTALAVLARYAHRAVGLRAFGVALLLDGLYLEYLHEEHVGNLHVQFAVAAFLIAATLLGSFRTGIKLAIWVSILLLIGHQAEMSGLIPTPGEAPGQLALYAELALLWLVVITAATAGAINERELRRRRYDAEALRAFATSLHRSEVPQEVLTTFVDFLGSELECGRILLCREASSGLELVAEHGLGAARPTVVQHVADSPLLRLATGADPILALRLDPARDPWLDSLLPGAERIVAARIVRGGSGAAVYLVLELRQRGTRVERRVVGTIEQAAATTSLALSRADLLVAARRSASTDGLTGAWNRRTFDAELARTAAAAHRDGLQASLIMVDVDHFKKVNDVHGHQVGDEVLVLVAHTLAAVLEELGDVGTAYRYGGEEFSVIVSDRDLRASLEVAEALRARLQNLDGPVPITASFGVAALGGAVTEPTTLLLRADEALLQAKQTGRNRVVAYAPSAAGVPAPRAHDEGSGAGAGTPGVSAESPAR